MMLVTDSRRSLPVSGEVADGRAMVSDDPQWSLVIFRGCCDHLVVERYGRREVVRSLLSVFYESAIAVRRFSVVGRRFH